MVEGEDGEAGWVAALPVLRNRLHQSNAVSRPPHSAHTAQQDPSDRQTGRQQSSAQHGR